MQCTNNLKQLGIAAHTHADANRARLPAGARDWNFLTWAYFILPYIEQQARYNQMSIQYHGPYGATPGGAGVVGGSDWIYDPADPSEGGRYDRVQNLRPMSEAISCYTCPSGGGSSEQFIVGANRWPKINYVACGGQTAVGYAPNPNGWADNYWALHGQGGDAADTIPQRGALFGMGLLGAVPSGMTAQQYRANTFNAAGYLQQNISVASDGLSNTILFSEMISTTGMGNNGSATSSDFRGGVYRGDAALFTTYYQPNTHRADEMMSNNYCHNIAVLQPCVLETSTRSYYEVRLSARSKHTGGVNAARGDGSVSFVISTVNVNAWRAAGAAQDGLSLSID
jgi:hypothetical protein